MKGKKRRGRVRLIGIHFWPVGYQTDSPLCICACACATQACKAAESFAHKGSMPHQSKAVTEIIIAPKQS